MNLPASECSAPPRTLVTGAAGFLGSEIVRQLVQRGESVRAFVRRPAPQLAELGAEVFLGDLRDSEDLLAACQGIECVHHTAAIAGIWGRWQDFYLTNTLATQHLVEACLAHGVGKLVFTSSPSVTFDGRDQQGIDESAPYPRRFLAHYPKSKALAEQAVLAANGQPHSQGQLLTCALRPHLIWGPGDPHLVPRVVQRARQGRLRRVGAGANLIDIIYVSNAAAGQIAAADALTPGSPVAGQAYFLSQGEPVNCWDWIGEILHLAQAPPVTQVVSAAAAYRIGGLLEGAYRIMGWIAEPPMTRFLAAQLSTSHWFDISRARRDFGFAPQITTAEGMNRLAASGVLTVSAPSTGP